MLPIAEVAAEFRHAGLCLFIGLDGGLNVFPASKRNKKHRDRLELLLASRHPEMKRYLMSITQLRGEE